MTYTLTDLNPVTASFREDVISGLSGDPKTLDCKYLYDSRGVELFNAICELDDYYITRLETKMLAQNADAICEHVPDDSHIIEYGSGSADKIRFLFDRAGKVATYTAIDISLTYVKHACEKLSADYPGLTVKGICGDYLASDLPIAASGDQPRVVFFPGSTMGNLERNEIDTLLAQSRRHVGQGGWFFLGVDLVKPIDTLKKAYDDSEGVTAKFNLNLLRRINSELDGDFDREQFHHEARWNPTASRIEMHLVSSADQQASIGDKEFTFAEGETIFTESSHKFSPQSIRAQFAAHGYTLRQSWQDPKGWFGHFLFQRD